MIKLFGRIIIFTKELYQKHHKETDHDAQKLLHEMITLEEVRITYLEKSRYVPALLPLEHLKHDDVDDGAAGQTWGRGQSPNLPYSEGIGSPEAAIPVLNVVQR